MHLNSLQSFESKPKLKDRLGNFVFYSLIASCVFLLSTLAMAGKGGKGNGAPSGAHYNLNIIGMSKAKIADMSGDNCGHRIFVALNGKSRINLQEGEFKTLDCNASDGSPALFQLPHPDPENDGVTGYSVFARALGTPGGKASIVTCATDVETDEEYCSTEQLILARKKGKSVFGNVSNQLLYIYADLDGDGSTERYPLFDDALEDYYWSYDNNGMRIMQLRFYPISTNVN